MKYKFFIFGLIFFLKGETLPLELADFYVKENNFSAAIIEYERHLFFHSNRNNQSAVLTKLYQAYYENGNLNEALNVNQTAYLNTQDISVKEQIKFDEVSILLSMGDISKAEFILSKIYMSSKDLSSKKKASYYMGLCNLHKYNWNQSKKYFIQHYGEEHSTKIDSIFSITDNFDLKSPKLAKTYSTILPGLGQAYARDYKNGINSFLLNGLIAYALINPIKNTDFKRSITILFLLSRYYLGGLARAELITNNYNKTKLENTKKIIYQNILAFSPTRNFN